MKSWKVTVKTGHKDCTYRRFIVKAPTSSMAINHVMNDAAVGRMTDIIGIHVSELPEWQEVEAVKL